jgi:hypothetical protein
MINKNINKEEKNEVLTMMEGLKELGVDFEFKIIYKNLTLVSAGFKEQPKPSFECFPNYSPLWLIDRWKREKNANR